MDSFSSVQMLENSELLPLSEKVGSGSWSSRSRSTSAGSTPGCSTPTEDVGNSPTLESALPLQNGLPEVDYPAPRLEAVLQKARSAEFSYPSPFVVRNTFLDTADRTPNSRALLEFFKERQIQSCPASGIAAPPGLEHLGSGVSQPEAPRAKTKPVADFQYPAPVDCGHGSNKLPNFLYPAPMVIENTFLKFEETCFGSQIQAPQRETQSCPASGIAFHYSADSADNEAPGFHITDNEMTSGFSSDIFDSWTSDEMLAEQMRHQHAASIAAELVARAPVLVPVAPPAYAAPEITTAQNLSVPPPPPMALPPAPAAMPLVPPPPDQAPKLCIAESLGLQTPEIGSSEAPNLGSLAHQNGTCKPCAFIHTKGCEDGTKCRFCHLCPPGEKKRRQKAKAVAYKLASNGVEPEVAVATAVSWAIRSAAASEMKRSHPVVN
eukprot:TRINITY_DN111811_c0_g1_i1.p1 TRINITY_DN111811_c0_g1~~TRINITY_DN111811_c0_g1_i1.p1  ORF type:complete len:436 (-),score=98.31 TRINITY_DN111811_c0_g1_i1:235-1542(-)